MCVRGGGGGCEVWLYHMSSNLRFSTTVYDYDSFSGMTRSVNCVKSKLGDAILRKTGAIKKDTVSTASSQFLCHLDLLHTF